MVRRLADQGARVVVAARRADRLRQLVEECSGLPGAVETVEVDVTVAADCERLVASAAAAFGGIDVLVNNAGMEIQGHWRSWPRPTSNPCSTPT